MSYIQMTKATVDNYINKCHIIACGIRNSRLKAKRVAIMELYTALLPMEVIYLPNGPLSDVKGFICFMVNKEHIKELENILHKIGYCNVFYLITFEEAGNNKTWKGRQFNIKEFVIQDSDLYSAQSPHNRLFAIGEKNVKGYRGDGSLFGRRALPVEDCRCLVNLAIPNNASHILDPFAGAGGIAYSCRFINPDIQVTTIDIDPILSSGLRMYGASHYVGNTANIKLHEKFDAIVTEVPFAVESDSSVLAGLRNTCEYLKSAGRISIMCSLRQYEIILKFINEIGLHVYCSHIVNRKGTDTAIIAATRDEWFANKISPLVERLETIY
ncbi:MAG: hypothetical protein FWB80_10635 [Defluviitaleaceae bacterium]|nr:hypothetical protein [Defluviitaleaceae bacterium]